MSEKEKNIAAQEAKPEEKTPAPTNEKKKGVKKNPFNSKKFKHGGLSVAFTVIFVTAIVLINVIFNLALSRFDISADLTEGAILSLSDEAKDYLSGVSNGVSFYVTNEEKTMRESSDKLQKQVVLFLDKMTELNGIKSIIPTIPISLEPNVITTITHIGGSPIDLPTTLGYIKLPSIC